MKKIITGLVLSGIFVLTVFSGCGMAKPADPPKQTEGKFAVYTTSNDREIFSDSDIIIYDATTHTFTFTEEGTAKIKSFHSTMDSNKGLYGEGFSVRLGETELFKGKFWTSLSSQSENGIIMTDVVMFGPDFNTLTVQSGYPGPGDSPDNEFKMDDPRIIEHFKNINKLQQ